MALIIKNSQIVTAGETYKADIFVENEKIAAIGAQFHEEGHRVIDAEGKMVLPGGVDVHVHLDLPMFGTVSSDDHYTGSKAAAFGGTTTLIDFIPQELDSLRANIDAWRKKAESKAAVDYGFHMNITRLTEQVIREMPVLVEEGIRSIKVFTAYNGRLRLLDGEIFQVMRVAKKLELLTMMHAENGDVIDLLVSEALAQGKTSTEWHARTRPAWGAVESVLRGEALAAQAEAMLYIVHMNAGGEVDQLNYGRSKGLQAMGETCPQYLFFDESYLGRPDGAKWICSPPMRLPQDNHRLWEGIADGTIHVVSTDHCPFFFDGKTPIMYEGKPIAIPGKELGEGNFSLIPNGLPGVGDRMAIMWSYGVGKGKISANQFVALHCTNPAKIFGLYPQKGAILPGADADIVIWDPEKEVKYGVNIAQHRTDYNLYEGWALKGYPEKVFLRGELIVDGQSWYGKAGNGRYLKRGSPIFF
jgi:dihydropyrimidinase